MWFIILFSHLSSSYGQTFRWTKGPRERWHLMSSLYVCIFCPDSEHLPLHHTFLGRIPPSGFSDTCCLVTKSCLTLHNPVGCSTPGSSVLHCLLEFAQNHVRWGSDAVYPSHPLPFPFPFVFSLSQHQGLFPVMALHIRWPKSASASVFPMNIQGWFLLGLTGLISLLSKGLSRVFSSTTVQKHPFFSTQAIFMAQLSHLYMTVGKTVTLTILIFVTKWCLCFLTCCLALS